MTILSVNAGLYLRDDADSIVKKQGKILGKKPIQMSRVATEYGCLHISSVWRRNTTTV